MKSELKLVEIKRKGNLYRDFLELPFIVQEHNPVWVPPLRIQQKELLDPKKNPFFKHAAMRKFIVYKNGKPCGRIAAINDDAHNQTHQETTCHFGHFECIDDQDVADLLFGAVEKAAREWNLDLVRGPFNPSINEDCGLLVEGFEHPPTIMMPYNPPYYVELIEKYGFSKTVDLFCYLIRQEDMTEKLKRGAEILLKRSKYKFRTLNMKNFWEEAYMVRDIYGDAWKENWGAVPMTNEEFDHMAKNLKSVVDPDFVFIAETPEGKPVGFSLALPDINEAIIKIRNGRLFPFGLLKLLWYTRKGALHGQRVLLTGVLKEHRGKGIDSIFFYKHFNEGKKKNFGWGEMSWILETNTMMNRAAVMMGGKKYKTYRICEVPVN